MVPGDRVTGDPHRADWKYFWSKVHACQWILSDLISPCAPEREW